MRHISILLLFIIFQPKLGYSQYLAKVGNLEISPEAYKIRYEFTPKANTIYSSDSSKINFLYSLIAEKLWALEAKSISLDTSQYVINSVRDIERKLVRDKLYKIEIESRINISKDEIEKDLYKVEQKRIVKFLFSNSKNDISDLYRKINQGTSFDSLMTTRAESKDHLSGIPVVYGQMNSKLEEIIFNLSINEYSAPTAVQGGWIIYKLVRIENENISGNNAKRAAEKSVQDVRFSRKAKLLYQDFYDSKIKGKEISVNPRLINSLSNYIQDALQSDSESFTTPIGKDMN